MSVPPNEKERGRTTPEDLDVRLALRQLSLLTVRQVGALMAVLGKPGILRRREVLGEMEQQPMAGAGSAKAKATRETDLGA